MASTLVESPSAGGRGEGSSSVFLNRLWLDLPWRRIIGRYDFHPLGVKWSTLSWYLDYIHPVVEAEGSLRPSCRWLGRSRYHERLKVVCRSDFHFSQDLRCGIGWGGHLYWDFIRLGLPCNNVGEIDFPSPVAISNRNVSFRNIRHLFSLSSSYPWVPLLINYSIK